MKSTSRKNSGSVPDTASSAKKVAELEAQVKTLQLELKKAQNRASSFSKIKHFLRQLTVLFLVILTALNFTFSVSALWLKRNVIDTETWVNKTTALIENPDIRNDISVAITNQIFTQAEVEKYIAQALPDQIDGLSAPLTNSLESFTATKVDSALQSDAFIQFWETANRSAHDGIVDSLDNGGVATDEIKAENVVYVDNNQLVLNLKPVFNNIKAKLSAQGLTFVDRFSGDRIAGTITLTEIENLDSLLRAFDTINKMAIYLPIFGLFTGIGALWLAKSKRKTLVAICLTTVAFLIASVQLIYLTSYSVVQSITDTLQSTSTASAQAFFEIITDDYILMSRALMALLLCIVLGAFLTGYSKAAVSLRAKVGSLLTFKKEESAAISWIVGHTTLLISSIIGLGVLLLIAPLGEGPSYTITIVLLGILSSFIVISIAQANKNINGKNKP